MHTNCTRCHRALKTVRHHDTDGNPLGPTCAKRRRQEAATTGIKPDTLAKAIEDIEDGALIDTRYRTRAGNRVFEVLSSNGRDRYLATPNSCTCKAGHAGRVCRHRAAAILTAA